MNFRIALMILSVSACAVCYGNEANNRFGDRSWQFQTPNEVLIKQNNLVLYCQRNPSQCNQTGDTPTTTDRGITPPNNGGGSGENLSLGGGDGIIGNNITIVINGDGNVVEVSGDQTLADSDQTINHTVSDNNVSINSTQDSEPTNTPTTEIQPAQ